MRRRRLTIGYAMVAVAGTAFALAALRGSSQEWWIASYIAMLTLFCWATLGAFLLRGPARAPWTGIAVFGWAFFVLLKVDEVLPTSGLPIHTAANSASLVVYPERTRNSADLSMSPAEAQKLRDNDALQARQLGELRSYFTSTLLVFCNVTFALIGVIAGHFFVNLAASRGPSRYDGDSPANGADPRESR